MHLRFTFLLLVFISFFTNIQAQYIEVEDAPGSGLTPEELALQVLQNNDFTVTNVTFEGAPQAMGSFLGTEVSPIGINQGMVLTTGRVASNGVETGVDGMANNFATSANGSTASSPDLMQLDPTLSNNDVANLIIEFIPNTDTLVVDFVFGSEEYPEYVCSGFNDAFGLFLTGPGISGPFSNGGENIARIPETDTYISINTIHPGNGGGCPAQNEEYYIANTDTPISLDGFTTVIPIRYPVIPFETYIMTLSVADKGDSVFDSATFLQFSDCTSGFCNFFNPEKALISENCEATNVYLDLSDAPTEIFPFELSLAGEAINGTDYETLDETFVLTADNPILDFDIVPVNDTEIEGIEEIELQVSSNGEYVKSVFYYLNEDLPIEVNAVDNCDLGVQIAIDEPNSPVYNFENNTSMTIAPAAVLIKSEIEVSGLPYDELFSPGLIKEVCINVEHNWMDDLDFYLLSPGGKRIILSTDNGGNGNDFTNTCFSPTATNGITLGAQFSGTSATPFTGQWQPEGLWSDLANTSTNGTWTLLIKDDSNGFTGTLLNWSITFHESILLAENIVWSNGETGTSFDYDGEFPLNISAEITNSNCSLPFSFELDATVPGVAYNLIEQTTCDADFAITVEGTIYNIDNPTGENTIVAASYTGCDSTIVVNLTYLEAQDNIYMSEEYIEGESILVEGTVFDAPGFYTIPVEDEASGCSYNVELSYLPAAPIYYYDVISNAEVTEIECNQGGEYCFNIQRYDNTNYELILDGESIGNVNDFPVCEALTERRFDIPAEVYDLSRTWTIIEIGNTAVAGGYFQGSDEMLQHLDFLTASAQFFSITDIAVPKIITRTSTDIETITILDIDDNTELTLFGDLADIATGALVPLAGNESQISVYNPATLELQAFDLNVNLTTETNEQIVFIDFIETNTVINPVELIAAPDELCGEAITAANICNGSEILDLNVALNEDGTATVTGTVDAFINGDVTICIEFCDAFGNCDVDTYILGYLLVNSIEENSISQSINVYPNPAQNEIAIILNDSENLLKSVNIYSLNGQEVRQQKLKDQSVIDISDLAAGVYILKIDTENGIGRKRLVVVR